ncbi:MAG: hypothetical protein M3Y04_06670 [Actinomycetota bacterium]|nr:hypothetical protein [Actinomycetota bacterium]
MTSPSVAPVSSLPESPQFPDHLTDPGIQFSVEWQVVERIQGYPAPQPVEAWELS